jgi:predicted GTPase
VSGAVRTLTLSLISHTNVGKTTLARTLLRRDVGQVADRAHVTDQSERFPLVETADGHRVVLWDTPGFGDSVRLLKRLRAQEHPLGWILAQVWDRFAGRPLWCSQQAVKNARDEADVVLYLVNAAEDPALAAYVDAEMQVLTWIGRPVVVLLNQTGTPRDAGARRREEERWRSHVAAVPVVRDVVDLDALTRCWVQEGLLLDRVRAVVPGDRQDLMDALIGHWTEENRRVFRASIQRLAHLLAGAAADAQPLPGSAPSQRARKRAAEALAGRLASRTRTATEELIELHGLEGSAATEVRARLEDVAAPGERPEPWKAGLLGGLAGGALGGLAADVAAGGLTFGAGTVVGAILGAMGLGGLAWGYQMLGAGSEARVTWSIDFLHGQARDALLRYLAVAHFGRGGGHFRERDEPGFWREAVTRALASRSASLEEVWLDAQRRGGGADAGEVAQRLAPLLEHAALDVLVGLYPGAERFLAATPGPD